MHDLVFYIMCALCAAAMAMERLGLPTTLSLNFKGDVKRETRWLAQYGQLLCTIAAALLIWRLDRRPADQGAPAALMVAVVGTSVVAFAIKRAFGRVRPGRDKAGQFLGFTWKHANYRESFPSSHSASAVAMTVVLSSLYPAAAAIFWTLAITCALLRYVMDAHWPSDIFGGIALGYGLAHLAWKLMMPPGT